MRARPKLGQTVAATWTAGTVRCASADTGCLIVKSMITAATAATTVTPTAAALITQTPRSMRALRVTLRTWARTIMKTTAALAEARKTAARIGAAGMAAAPIRGGAESRNGVEDSC
jgi:hypothetical protein